jgi:hypothetical protein
MLNRRLHLTGLFAVLLALMAQLGMGATVPRMDPLAELAGAQAICHAADVSATQPGQAPSHPMDCLVCPLCIALHASPAALIPAGTALPPPSVISIGSAVLVPPARAPPSPHRPPGQPRAPPIDA